MIRLLTFGSVVAHSFTPTAHAHVEHQVRINSVRTMEELKQLLTQHIRDRLYSGGGFVNDFEIRSWFPSIDQYSWDTWLKDYQDNPQNLYRIQNDVISRLKYGSDERARWFLNLYDRMAEFDSRINTLSMIGLYAGDAAARDKINAFISKLQAEKWNILNSPIPNIAGLDALLGDMHNIQGINMQTFDQIHSLINSGAMNWDPGHIQSLVNSITKSREFTKFFGKGLLTLTKMQQIFMFVVSGILAIMSALMAWLFKRNRKTKASKGIKTFIATTGIIFLIVSASLAVIALI